MTLNDPELYVDFRTPCPIFEAVEATSVGP